MTQDTTMIVELDVRESEGMWFVTSKNLDGLNVCGDTIESTYQSVVKAVKALYKYNRGFDVEVHPATTDGKDFPEMMHLCDQIVVQRKAA